MDPVVQRPGLLCGCLALLAVVWIVVLPAVSRSNGYGERTRALESKGIDPGAMFYTEHSRLLSVQPANTVDEQ